MYEIKLVFIVLKKDLPYAALQHEAACPFNVLLQDTILSF
jgi:hypothetical protein